MTSMLPTLFEQMRQTIINTAFPEIQSSPFDPAYLFSWYAGIYPLFDNAIDCHAPYDEYFSVPRDRVTELANYLEQLHLKGQTITFWKLEDVFNTEDLEEWDRDRLIDTCRYLYLKEMFSKEFWHAMLARMADNSVVQMITKPFDTEEIALLFPQQEVQSH